MDERDQERLEHMVNFARHAIALLGERDAAALDEDIRTLLAVAKAIEIVGESASKISGPVREAASAIPWRDITRMRHILVHDYFEIESRIVVETIRNDLPPLIQALEQLLGTGTSA